METLYILLVIFLVPVGLIVFFLMGYALLLTFVTVIGEIKDGIEGWRRKREERHYFKEGEE